MLLLADGDYSSYSDVIIPASPGSSRVCVDIPIIDDDIVEDIEKFIIFFENFPGTTTNTCIFIVDNDCE